MPDLLEISFHHKIIFNHLDFMHRDSILQVFPESLHFICISALVIDCAQPNCNPSRKPVNGEKC